MLLATGRTILFLALTAALMPAQLVGVLERAEPAGPKLWASRRTTRLVTPRKRNSRKPSIHLSEVVGVDVGIRVRLHALEKLLIRATPG